MILPENGKADTNTCIVALIVRGCSAVCFELKFVVVAASTGAVVTLVVAWCQSQCIWLMTESVFKLY